MSETGTHQFQLHDAAGVAHNYVVNEHPAGEGMELMYALLGLGAPAVLGLASAALRSEDMLGAVMRALSGGDSGVADTVGQMAADLDLTTVGVEVGKALGSGRAPDLTRRILSRTYRDGRSLGGVGGSGIDLAYQANYAELLVAVWRVCTINRFFPVPSTSQSSAKGSLEAEGSPLGP